MLTTPFLKFILLFLLEHQTLSNFLPSLWLLLLSFLLLPAMFPLIPKCWHLPESCPQTPFFSRHFPSFQILYLILSILLILTTIINCERLTQLSSPPPYPTKLQIHEQLSRKLYLDLPYSPYSLQVLSSSTLIWINGLPTSSTFLRICFLKELLQR